MQGPHQLAQKSTSTGTSDCGAVAAGGVESTWASVVGTTVPVAGVGAACSAQQRCSDVCGPQAALRRITGGCCIPAVRPVASSTAAAAPQGGRTLKDLCDCSPHTVCTPPHLQHLLLKSVVGHIEDGAHAGLHAAGGRRCGAPQGQLPGRGAQRRRWRAGAGGTAQPAGDGGGGRHAHDGLCCYHGRGCCWTGGVGLALQRRLVQGTGGAVDWRGCWAPQVAGGATARQG